MEFQFDHERLKVYQQAVAFAGWCDGVVERCTGKAAVKDQLDRASTSIVLNVAEGNGKFSAKERTRFFEIARGSALECAACLDLLIAKKRLTIEDAHPGKAQLQQIVSMLFGLINNASRRNH